MINIKMKKIVFSLLLSIGCSVCLFADTDEEKKENANPRDPRLWTSSVGRKLLGQYIKTEDGVVEIQDHNKRSVKIPLEKLSQKDVDFVKKHFEEDLSRKTASLVGKLPFESDVKGPVGWLKKQKKGVFTPDRYVYMYEEIMKYYLQNVPEFTMLPDLIENKQILEPKYEAMYKEKLNKEFVVKPEERRNLLTDKPIEYVPFSHEPQWDKVTQTLRVEKDTQAVTFYQIDVFSFGNDKKYVVITTNFFIPTKMSPVELVTFTYEEFYNGESFFYARFDNRRFEEGKPFDDLETKLDSFALGSMEKGTMCWMNINKNPFALRSPKAKYLTFSTTKQPAINAQFKRIEDYFSDETQTAKEAEEGIHKGRGYFASMKDSYLCDAYTQEGEFLDISEEWGPVEAKVKGARAVNAPPKNFADPMLNLFKERSAVQKKK